MAETVRRSPKPANFFINTETGMVRAFWVKPHRGKWARRQSNGISLRP